MNIEKIHEYRYLQAFVVEVFGFQNLFFDHHRTVCRSHDHIFPFTGEMTARRAKEIKNQGEEYYGSYKEKNIEPLNGTKVKKRPVDDAQKQKQCYQNVPPLSMYLHSHFSAEIIVAEYFCKGKEFLWNCKITLFKMS